MNQLPLFELPTPSMPVFDASRCVARPINYQTAANMVEKYHYAHRVPSIVLAIGMYVDDVLAGCVTYGIPPVPNVQRACGEKYRHNALELNRLFIHDWAGRNSESWLIGQSFHVLESLWTNYFVLVSYADTKHKHLGRIYQATNWLYTGLSSVEACEGVLLKDGTVTHRKNLVNMFGTSSRDSVATNLDGATIVSGQAKHRYVYFLGSKKQRRELRKALRWPILPYPKDVK